MNHGRRSAALQAKSVSNMRSKSAAKKEKSENGTKADPKSGDKRKQNESSSEKKQPQQGVHRPGSSTNVDMKHKQEIFKKMKMH